MIDPEETFEQIQRWIFECGRKFRGVNAGPGTMREIAHHMALLYYQGTTHGRAWPVSPVPFSARWDPEDSDVTIMPSDSFLEWLASFDEEE